MIPIKITQHITSLILNWFREYRYIKLGDVWDETGEAEMVVEGAEKVADVVEKVAMRAEKVAEDVSENLSDGSNLKNAALIVENISKQAAHDAHLTENFLHKVLCFYIHILKYSLSLHHLHRIKHFVFDSYNVI